MTKLLCLCALGAMLASLGCSAAERRYRPDPDCAEEQKYELRTTTVFNDPSIYFVAPKPGFPDPATALTTLNQAMLGAEELCGHTSALVFKTQGNHDWGSIAGTYAPPNPTDNDASDYEGISFWARGLYDRSMSINLEDATVNVDAGQCIPSEIDKKDGTWPLPNPDFYDDTGLPVANGCNLSFTVGIIPTEWWSFYTIPFSAFTQGGNTPDARRRPEGIDRSTISRIVWRAPKDTFVENWYANVAWYRPRE